MLLGGYSDYQAQAAKKLGSTCYAQEPARIGGVLGFCPQTFGTKMVEIKAVSFSSSLDSFLGLVSKAETGKGSDNREVATAHAWPPARHPGKADPGTSPGPQLTLGSLRPLAFPG